MSQSWSEITANSGIYGQPELSKQARVISRKQTKFYDVVDKASEFNIGKQSGDKVGCRMVGRITTLSDAALGEFQKLPFAKAPEYTKTITVYRRGLASVWTGSRADLDRIDVNNKTIEALRDQAARTLNKIIRSILVASRSFTYAALSSSTYSFTSNGTPGGAANAAFSLFHLRKLKLCAKQYNIPPMDGQNWWFIGSPGIEDNLHEDVSTNGFVDVAKYAPGRVEGLLNGEIGKVGSVRFSIDNDQALDNIGTGTQWAEGFLCGQETCKEVMVYPMHFRYNGNLGGEFGNMQAVAWQSMSGYDTIWNYGSHGQASYIHYTSS